MSEIVHCYSRREAIADGVLVDASGAAREAGFRFPVALTAAVWSEYVTVPTDVPHQDEAGRLWDILWMLRYGISQASDESMIRFVVHVQNDDGPPRPVHLKAICGPGDEGEPVITILLPNED